MSQVGLEQQWLHFLREYIRPVQVKVFIGYDHDVSHCILKNGSKIRDHEQLTNHNLKPITIDIIFCIFLASKSNNELCSSIQADRAIFSQTPP